MYVSWGPNIRLAPGTEHSFDWYMHESTESYLAVHLLAGGVTGLALGVGQRNVQDITILGSGPERVAR